MQGQRPTKDVFFFFLAFCVNTDSDETFDRVKEKNSELLRRTEAVSLWASHVRTVALSVPLRTSSENGGMREGGRAGREGGDKV